MAPLVVWAELEPEVVVEGAVLVGAEVVAPVVVAGAPVPVVVAPGAPKVTPCETQMSETKVKVGEEKNAYLISAHSLSDSESSREIFALAGGGDASGGSSDERFIPAEAGVVSRTAFAHGSAAQAGGGTA